MVIGESDDKQNIEFTMYSTNVRARIELVFRVDTSYILPGL